MRASSERTVLGSVRAVLGGFGEERLNQTLQRRWAVRAIP